MVVSCTGTAPGAAEFGGSTSSSSLEPMGQAGSLNPERDPVAPRGAVPERGTLVHAAPARSATFTSPFGRADFYGGVGVVRDGVWVSLGPNDVPGPLWDAPENPRAKATGRVYDVCVLEEAWIISYGYEPGPGVLANFAGPWRRNHPECSTVDDPAHDLFPRWSYVGEVRSSPYFKTKAEAFAWGHEIEDELRQLISGPLPLYARPLGMVGESRYEQIEFAGVLDSSDPVRVVPESLAYEAGTLRGLVRNGSPRRFAYKLQVSLSGAVWQWPLSIQPGELAPFALTGLALEETPSAQEISIDVELRDDADVSRAFDFGCSPHWFGGNAYDLEFLVPDVVFETLPRGGLHTLALYCADPNRRISSHPDWEGDNEPVHIGDLRSYVAFIDYSGRVLEVRKLITFTEYYTDQGGKDPLEVITSIPSERVIADKNYRSSRVLVAFAAPNLGSSQDDFIHSAQWVLWIGGSHLEVGEP